MTLQGGVWLWSLFSDCRTGGYHVKTECVAVTAGAYYVDEIVDTRPPALSQQRAHGANTSEFTEDKQPQRAHGHRELLSLCLCVSVADSLCPHSPLCRSITEDCAPCRWPPLRFSCGRDGLLRRFLRERAESIDRFMNSPSQSDSRQTAGWWRTTVGAGTDGWPAAPLRP
jgi:hypothetical protein